MNKLKTYIRGAILSGALLLLIPVSCTDYLDKEYDVSLIQSEIFNDQVNTRGFLVNIYRSLPNGFSGFLNTQFLGGFRDAMTDNAVSYWNVHYYHGVQTDGYDATNHPFNNIWTDNFTGIRKCNVFLANAKDYVVGSTATYNRYMAEARLLRAIFHMELIRYYGAVPIIGDDSQGKPIIFNVDRPEEMNMERTAPAEALKWVADECDKVKGVLTFRPENLTVDWGRVTGAVAYALKSRALLYRASPLNNTGNNATYWTEAAQAARDFIAANNLQSTPYRLNNTGNPNKDYYDCFAMTPTLNPEYMLSFETWSTTTIETELFPCGYSGSLTSAGRMNPTQNLVDCYETKNGLPIDQDPTYNPQNPYNNRDPRLDQTVFRHGTIWGNVQQGENRAVDVSYPAGKDYKELHGGTLTGYYLKKFVNEISFKVPSTPIHGFPLYRYGEILLNAAEAVNEAEGPANAYVYINELRSRVGMPPYSGMTKLQLRERIQNERRIELCFEDHRFFDERRWLIFEGQTQASEATKPVRQQYYNLYGVNVTLPGPVFTLKRADTYPTRAFNTPKNYLFPLRDAEVKRAPKLKQNPGWELN
jgi:hypothetical protein